MTAAWITVRLKALRAFSLPLSVLPVLVAFAAAEPVGHWDWPVAAAVVAGAALLHLAGNLLNDYFDFRSGVDRPGEGPPNATRGVRGPDDDGMPGRVLARGELRPRDVLWEATVCGLLALVPVLYVTGRRGPGALALAGAGAAAVYAYTGEPLKLKYRALGELLIFAAFGPGLMIASAWLLTGLFVWRAAMLSLPVGLATTSVLVGNNLRDRLDDARAGIRTLAHVAGGRLATWLYVLLPAAATVAPCALAAVGLAPRALLAAPVLLLLLARPVRCVLRGRRLPNIDVRTAAFSTALMLLMLAGLLVEPPGG